MNFDFYTPSEIRRYKSGLGQGHRENYLSWLTFTDFNSKGITRYQRGIKIDRFYLCFSSLEYYTLRTLEQHDQILDIREQFPLLNKKKFLAIANRLGINPPRNPWTKTPIITTSDFFLTLKNRNAVRSVKPSKDLESKRILEKLELERTYWSEEGVDDFSIITEEDINGTFAQNWDLLSSYYYEDELNIYAGNYTDLKDLTLLLLRELEESEPTQALFRDFDEKYGLKKGDGMQLYYHLLSHKLVDRDLSIPLNFN